MSAYDIYAAALAPYVTRTPNRVPNLSGAIQKMIDYNSKMNLGLTDEQIVAGIKAFGDRSAKQWGTATPVAQSSNYNAIAAESIERALTLAGKDGSAFWNNAVKDAYPVTSDGVLPGMPAEGGSWATKVVRGMPDQNWDYDKGGYFAVPNDPLEQTLNNWISNQPLSQYLYSGQPTNVVSAVTGQRPLNFSDQQRKTVADMVRGFNDVLGLKLTDEELAQGINQFSRAQYDIYQQGYNVGSDPYNIARWSVWNALNNAGKTEVGDMLIEKTNAKQALTAPQAEELYNKANSWVNTTAAEIERQMDKANDLSFGDHFKNIARGVAPIAALFSGFASFLGPAGGAAAGVGSAGALSSLAESLGIGEFYNTVSGALDLVGGVGTDLAAELGLSGEVAKAFATGIDSAIKSGGLTGLTGGDLNEILQSAGGSFLTGGLSQYTGAELKNLFRDLPTDFPLADIIAKTGAGGVGGTINAWLNERDIGDGALLGATSGLTSGVLSAAGVPDFVAKLVRSGVNQELAEWLAEQSLESQPPPTTPTTLPVDEGIPPPPAEPALEEEQEYSPVTVEGGIIPSEDVYAPPPDVPVPVDMNMGREAMFGTLPTAVDLGAGSQELFGGLEGGVDLSAGREDLFKGFQPLQLSTGGTVRNYEDGGSVEPFYYDDWGTGSTSYGDMASNWEAYPDIDYSYTDPYPDDYGYDGVSYMSDKALSDLSNWDQILASVLGSTFDPTTHLSAATSEDPMGSDPNAGWSGETLGYKPAELRAYLRGTSSINPMTGRADARRGQPGTSPSPASSGIAGALTALGRLYYSDKKQKAGKSAISAMLNRSPSFNAPLTPQGSLGKPVQALLSALSQQSSRAPVQSPLTMYDRPQLDAAKARNAARRPMAHGGSMGAPEFEDDMALGYVAGGTAGQDDKIPALLSDGEFVIDAETVSMLGDGNNEAGASALEQFRRNIRQHKRAAPVSKIPPKAKQPEQYLKGAV